VHKVFALSLLCAGLAGLAWAAEPPAQPPTDGPAACKVCVAEPTTKKVVKVVYEEKEVDYCLPGCSFFGLLRGGCACGAGPGCGKPRTRKVLIKRFVTEECPATKCEVREAAPACPAPCPR
jgi:hypothetical protein